ncbi:MgtC/SapB family protein [Rhizobiaceae bacterium n13]|uniref:Protein MgtC n=1 Tax=Ferirhizobium litorale TaxID=2927786 RepID=A0AAE3U238_9HYPH|nr:MgtC/SapB family protein [Fererhizobium litorale]MDI7860820.1 MgtC/SapB family protein [Fererhizobium litorale]MDI7920968.1 MgtC/SapB family protein [Fererhizobium litorale]
MLSVFASLVIALLLGALVGLERQWNQGNTGLTTHALVALGAAAFCVLPQILPSEPDVRMGGQVVTGIGFLGAGLILRDGFNIRGLSTAATVWATGAVGVLAGYGYFLAAAETAVLIKLTNIAMPRLGRLIEKYAPAEAEIERYYIVELKCGAHDEAAVRTMLLQAMNVRKLRLHAIESHAVKETTSVEVEAVVYSQREEDQLVEALVGELSRSPNIFFTRWTSTAPPIASR